MPVVVAIGVVSVIAATLMIRSAITVGFGVLVAPIVLAELVFLGAVYLIWRGLGGGEHGAERVEGQRPDAGRGRANSSEAPSVVQRAARQRDRPRSVPNRVRGFSFSTGWGSDAGRDGARNQWAARDLTHSQSRGPKARL